MIEDPQKRPRPLLRAFGSVVLSAAACMLVAGVAGAARAAAPQTSSPPAIAGQPTEGHTLTASTGGWTNTPTAFAYQWQQCDASGANCSAVLSATSHTYVPGAGDADHTLRVVVTATNADGSASQTSAATSVVSSAKAPVNTGSPTISGTATVGDGLSASTGTWTGGARSFSYQWQRCDSAGGSCAAIADATAKAYGVQTADVGSTLRVVVTATNLSGSSSAPSAPSAAVSSGTSTSTTSTTTTTTSTPVPARNHAPSLRFLSLTRIGARLTARFVVCDDSSKAVHVTERDVKAFRATTTRHFLVAGRPCSVHARTWTLAVRFRHHGRFTVTLRAVDRQGASSPARSRSLIYS